MIYKPHSQSYLNDLQVTLDNVEGLILEHNARGLMLADLQARLDELAAQQQAARLVVVSLWDEQKAPRPAQSAAYFVRNMKQARANLKRIDADLCKAQQHFDHLHRVQSHLDKERLESIAAQMRNRISKTKSRRYRSATARRSITNYFHQIKKSVSNIFRHRYHHLA